ncbi:hypothetical protein AX777_05905 [Sphingobium yanoikuyae]|uniref:Uncharacterized protein n=1 Tax=Sphingobium yanoikuyae TaxID=13690 RepID=A0A177JQW1_SPHYA|nr:hypothetical protein [Sphingobium yanoikuyae]OAH42771.1 hypothetical protein AX777_05905 [Sphingobium yanoikuyae]
MATIYEQFANAATRMYAGPLGASFKLVTFSGGGYDAQGNEIAKTTKQQTVRGVIKNKEVWNNGAYLGTRLVAMLDSKHQPKPDDQLIVGKTTYTITTVDTIAPDGVTVIRYEAGLQ